MIGKYFGITQVNTEANKTKSDSLLPSDYGSGMEASTTTNKYDKHRQSPLDHKCSNHQAKFDRLMCF